MKVKLIYANHEEIRDRDGYYETFIASSIQDTEWDELKESEYWDLQQAVNYKNRKCSKEKILLIRKPEVAEKLTPKLIASEYLKYLKQEELERKKSEEDYKNKQIESKKKRDLAKLEKLKKQYEKENSVSK